MINILGLIEMYNTYNTQTVYHEVAGCLLRHFSELEKLSASEIAELCNVSPSTLQRFFKKMEYPMTVSKLPNIFNNAKMEYLYNSEYAPSFDKGKYKNSIVHYFAKMNESLEQLSETIDESQLEAFVKDIMSSKKIIFLGCPIPQEVWRFQVDLIMNDIESTAFLSPNEQFSEINAIEDGSLIVYFDYYKSIFNQYQTEILKKSQKQFKVAIISNNNLRRMNCDYAFHFNGNNSEQDFIIFNVFMNILGVKFKELI